MPAPLVDALLHRFRAAPASVIAVLHNFGWMVASRGVAAVFSLIYLAIVTRSLGVVGYGRFALITGAAQFLSSLLAFQTWQIVVQYGVEHLERGDEARLARLYRAALLLDLSSALLGVFAAGFILYFFSEQLGLKDTLARATMVFNTVMLLSTRSTAIGILRLRDRFSLAAAADSITPIFRLIGAVLVFVVHSTLQGYLIAWAAAELATAAAHWLVLAHIGEFRLLLRRGLRLAPVLTDNPGIARYAITTNFSQSLTVATRQLPLFLVGGLTGTAAAGAFRLAAQLSRSLTIVSQMIARAAFPEIVRAVRQGGVAGLGTMIMRTIRLALVVGAAVFSLVLLLGYPLLKLIGGSAFGSGYVTLLWLAAAGCVDLVIVAFEPSIAAANRAHLAFTARLAAGAAMIAAALILAPGFGANGVAAAVFINGVTQALLLGALLAYLINMNPAANIRADTTRADHP